MEKLNIKKIIIDALLLEGAPLSVSTKGLFTLLVNVIPGTSAPTPESAKTAYNNKFAVEFPDANMTNRIMTFVGSVLPLSRGGVAGFEQFSAYFPFVDLLCIVCEQNGVNSSKIDAAGTLDEGNFIDTNSVYQNWFKQLNNSPLVKGNPLNWQPLSFKGTAIKKQIDQDQIQRHAAEFNLKTNVYATRSIMFAITQLLESRKEVRWNAFKPTSSLKIPFTTKKERELPQKIKEIFKDPMQYASGKKKFPPDIANRYESGGGLEEKIYELALSCRSFFESEKMLYFKDDDPKECATVLEDLLTNEVVERGTDDGFFHFVKRNGDVISANLDDGIGKGGYTIKNLEQYAPKNEQAKDLWDRLVTFASFTLTATWSWKEVLGGANSAVGAINSFGGKFGT